MQQEDPRGRGRGAGCPPIWREYGFDASAWNDVDDVRFQLVMALGAWLVEPAQLEGAWSKLLVSKRDGSTVLHVDCMRLEPRVVALMEESPATALACLSIAVNEVRCRCRGPLLAACRYPPA